MSEYAVLVRDHVKVTAFGLPMSPYTGVSETEAVYAVSYTHLDVYKRQLLCRCQELGKDAA